MKKLFGSLMAILLVVGLAPAAFAQTYTAAELTEIKGDYVNDTMLINNFSDGLAAVQSNRKYGFIDKTGKVVVPFIYDGATDFSNGMTWVVKDNKLGYIDQTGREVIPLVYDAYSSRFSKSFTNGLARVEKNGKIGFINKTGQLVIPAIYDNAEPFYEGLAWVRQGDHRAYINTEGKEVFSMPDLGTEYSMEPSDVIYNVFQDGVARITDYKASPSKYGFIDKTGKIIVAPIYAIAYPIQEGMSAVSKDNGDGFGYVDRSGQLVIPCQYQKASNFSDGLALVSSDGDTYHYINKTGKTVLTVPNAAVASDFHDGLAPLSVRSSGKMGLMDKSGKLVTPAIYDAISNYSDGVWMVKKGGYYGYVNQNGVEIIPPIYGSATPVNDGLAIVTSGKKFYSLSFNDKAQEKPAGEVSVVLNGQTMHFDVPPIITADRVLVPVRFVAERMGATVTWNQEKQEVTIKKDGTTILFTINQHQITVNGTASPLDAPPIVMDNRTLMPIRAVVEALGGQIEWNNDTRTVSITMET